MKEVKIEEIMKDKEREIKEARGEQWLCFAESSRI